MAAKNNFFISYTWKDKLWAEWIERILQGKGYTAETKCLDIVSGSNLTALIDNALIDSDRYIAVFTPSYFKSSWSAAEWTTALEKDPSNRNGTMVPIRAEECTPEGLMAPFVYIDLVGLSEAEASEALLSGINPPGRPVVKPVFTETKTLRFAAAYPPLFPVNNLPPRNINFTGRDELLCKICDSFGSGNRISNVQVLTGPGGVGKTETAYEFAYSRAGGFDTIWRFNAESSVTLFAGYAEFAHSIGIVDKRINERGIIADAIKDWINDNDRWLFIFDNAEKQRDIEGCIPVTGKGCILITSGNEIWLDFNKVQVDVFRAREAVEYLLKCAMSEDRENAARLAEQLGYLPAALEQAASYITSVKELGFEHYSELFKKQRQKLSEHDTGKLKDYAAIAKAAFNVSLENIKSVSAKQLLYICSYLSGGGIDKSIFTQCAEFLPEPLSREVKNEAEFSNMLFELSRLSLIKYDTTGFYTHDLLRKTITESIGNESIETCLKITRKKFMFEKYDKDSRVYFLSLSGHAFSIAGHAEKGGEGREEAGRIYADLGAWLMAAEAYPEALILFLKAQAIFESICGQYHPDTAAAYSNIGSICDYLGDRSKALEWCGKAVEIFEKPPWDAHPGKAAACKNLAGVYINQGDTKKALELFFKALEIDEKALGKEHTGTAADYYDVAETYRKMDEPLKAVEWCEKALIITERALECEYPERARIYDCCAQSYHSIGDNQKALELYEKALEVRIKVLGEYNTKTAAAYGSIAKVYHDMGEYKKAFELLLKELKVYIGRRMTGGREAKKTILELQTNFIKAGGKAEDFQKWIIEKMKEAQAV